MGKDSFFTISTRDYQGRSLGVGGDIFVVNLQTDDKKCVKVNLIDQGNGTYQGIYRAPAGTKGHMSLSVLLRGTHIQGSPFLVRVENPPVGEVRCYACGKKNRKMNYYINSNEPFRPEDTMRVRGYSALCVPGCLGYTYEDDWTLVCGPCWICLVVDKQLGMQTFAVCNRSLGNSKKLCFWFRVGYKCGWT